MDLSPCAGSWLDQVLLAQSTESKPKQDCWGKVLWVQWPSDVESRAADTPLGISEVWAKDVSSTCKTNDGDKASTGSGESTTEQSDDEASIDSDTLDMSFHQQEDANSKPFSIQAGQEILSILRNSPGSEQEADPSDNLSFLQDDASSGLEPEPSRQEPFSILEWFNSGRTADDESASKLRRDAPVFVPRQQNTWQDYGSGTQYQSYSRPKPQLQGYSAKASQSQGYRTPLRAKAQAFVPSASNKA